MIHLLFLGLRSLKLDWQFLRGGYPQSFWDKGEFIFKKYLIICGHLLFGVPLIPNRSRVVLGPKNYYYGSIYGLAVFQAMIVTLEKHIIPYLKKDKPVVVDVGAHLGFFSLPLTTYFHQPRIYAVEPVTSAYDLLKKNTYDVESIKSFHLGFWNKKENKTIYFDPQLLMYSSLFQKRFAWNDAPHHETVRLTTLDLFCRENKIKRINLLKIDAEGAEEKILSGATKTLSHTEYLFLECTLDQVDDATFTSLMSLLKGAGYNFQLFKIVSTLEHQGMLILVNMFFKNILFKQL